MSETDWSRSGNPDIPKKEEFDWENGTWNQVLEGAWQEVVIKGETKPKDSGLLPILHSPLPPVVKKEQKQFEVNWYEDFTVDKTTESEFLAAIDETKAAILEVEEAQESYLDEAKKARAIITSLNAQLELWRKIRDDNERESKLLRSTEGTMKSVLTRLQDMYTERIARKKEFDMLHEELEFFEMLARERPWGQRAFDFQLSDAQQMALEKRCVVGHEMGLGKTLLAIMAADLGRSARVLVITQNDIVVNFAREVGKWSPDRTMLALGDIKDRSARHFALRSLIDISPSFVVLINYEIWRRDPRLHEMLIEAKFDTVVIDEAHNMKDERGGNFGRIREIVYAENLNFICPNCGREFKHWPTLDMCQDCFTSMPRPGFDARNSVKRVYPMTGTAILNEPGDAFPILHLIDRVAFPDKKTYLQRYCIKESVQSLTGSWVDKWRFKWGGEEQLIRQLGSKYIRRTRDMAGIKLPPQDIQMHYIEFEEGEYLEQRKVIRDLYRVGQVLIKGLKGRDAVLSSNYIINFITRVRQALTFPAGMKLIDPETKEEIGRCPVTESIKIDCARNLINDLVVKNGQKVVLFSQFVAPLQRLHELLKEDGVRVVSFHGGIKQSELDRITLQADATFTKKEDMEFDVILVNYRKGGTGLNFTNITQTVVLDREWSPGKQEQSYGRTNRIGQTENTTVHIIEVKDSLDDDLRKLNERKGNIVSGLNEKVEAVTLIDYLEKKFKESP
jgi:SNF2 family DNA or RNA helicase